MARPRRSSGDETRRRLLDAGALLFARHGVGGVEIQTLQEAAGAKNQSAVRYHYGDREGLAQAVIERHVRDVEQRRVQLVRDVEADGAAEDLHRLIQAVLVPMTDSFDSEVGRAELRLVAQLNHPGRVYTERPFSIVDAPAGKRLGALLFDATGSLPGAIQRERLAALRQQVVQLVGLRARLIDARKPAEPDHSDEVWGSNLIDLLSAGLTCPVSDRTNALLSDAELQPPRRPDWLDAGVLSH